MAVAVREEKEETLRLHALAVLEQLLKAAGTEVGQALHQLVGLMEAFPIGKLIQKLQDRALGRGQRQGPAPMTPGLDGKAGLQRIGGDALAGLDVPAQAGQGPRDRLVSEEAAAAVKDEADGQRQLMQPRRGRLVPVNVYFGLLTGEVVGKALEFERCPAADDDRDLEQRLKRDDRLLPAQGASG